MIKVLISFILFTCCCCFINIPKINSKCYKEQKGNGYTVSGEFNINENDLSKSLFYCWNGQQYLIFPIVFTGNSSVSIKPTSLLSIVFYEKFTFEENVVVQFNEYKYNIMNYSVFKKNSFAILNSHFEIASNIQIIGKRELNK